MDKGIKIKIALWVARFGTAFGAVRLVMWTVFSIIAFAEAPQYSERLEFGDNSYAVMPFIFVGLAIIDILILVKTRKTRKLIGYFHLYTGFLAKDKSIDHMCAVLNHKKEDVQKRLEEMCKRKYIDGYIDFACDKLVLNDRINTAYVARCPGCGATTKIYHTGDTCRYCDNPLIRRNDAPTDNRLEEYVL